MRHWGRRKPDGAAQTGSLPARRLPDSQAGRSKVEGRSWGIWNSGGRKGSEAGSRIPDAGLRQPPRWRGRPAPPAHAGGWTHHPLVVQPSRLPDCRPEACTTTPAGETAVPQARGKLESRRSRTGVGCQLLMREAQPPAPRPGVAQASSLPYRRLPVGAKRRHRGDAAERRSTLFQPGPQGRGPSHARPRPWPAPQAPVPPGCAGPARHGSPTGEHPRDRP